MHTGIISFADRIVHNIKTNEMKDIILEQLYSLYGIKIIQKHYHKIDNNNIKYVINNPHLCCLRSNGNPYYMFFTLYNDIPIIYFIDKKVHPGYQKPRILLVRGLFDEKLYDNTLIDGEMVKCKNGKWEFIMNDILSYEGTYLSKKNLPERLKILYNLLEYQYKSDKIIDVCSYKIKTYFYVFQESIKDLIEISKKLPYTCRGIYMWSYDLKYKPKLYNFNEDDIIEVQRKVKDETSFKMINYNNEELNNNKCCITFEQNTENNNDNDKILWMTLSEYADVYYLYNNENVLISKKIDTALIPDLITSKMIRTAFKNKNATHVIKVNCSFNKNFNKWYPIKLL